MEKPVHPQKIDRKASGGKVVKDPGSAVVIVDGTVYELQIVSAQDEIISFRTYDYPLKAKAFDSLIVSWIKSVKELFDAKANLSVSL